MIGSVKNFSHIIMAKNQNTDNTKCVARSGEIQTLIYCW